MGEGDWWLLGGDWGGDKADVWAGRAVVMYCTTVLCTVKYCTVLVTVGLGLTDWTGLDCLSWEEALMPYAIKDDIPYVTGDRHSREPETP